MVAVIFCWWITKHVVHSQLQDFNRRSVYSNLFSSLSLAYPNLWTPTGPRSSIFPQTFTSRIKWRLIRVWANPYRTIYAGLLASDDGLGTLSRLRRSWMQLWTEQLAQELRYPKAGSESSSTLELGTENDGLIMQSIDAATNLLTVPGTTGIVDASKSRISRSPIRTPKSDGSTDADDAVLVEEKGFDWLRGPFKKPKEYGEPSKSPRPSSEHPRRGSADTHASSVSKKPVVSGSKRIP